MQITRLDPDFAVGGQIAVHDVAEIAAGGFATLVNNRPDGEARDQPRSAEIEAEAMRLGLVYCHIPVQPGQEQEANARRLAAVMRGATGPVFAFCRTGARSTALWKIAKRIDPTAPARNG
jgi:uncharacterized protein (TIGR01244 family)